MGYKTGENKNQLALLPMCLDDYVPENHICRVIKTFTDQLNMLALGYKYAQCKNVGNSPYNPRMMLNLYIYGYLHRVRSSRRLQAETTRNIEVMWIMDGLCPDAKTISNFRKDNAKSLRETFREFVKMCRYFGLYGGELIATDSTKFRADNSRKNNHNKTTVERELLRIDKNISEYMNAMDKADEAEKECSTPNADKIKEALGKLKDLKERKVKFETLLSQIEEQKEVSTVDPDSRLMRSGGDARPLDVCYNVQTVVDSKHHLIVDFDIIDRADDKGNIENMSQKAMDVLEVETITNLMDKGYYDGEDIINSEKNGVTCLVAKPKSGGSKKQEKFNKDKFVYDSENDCYVCPAQNQMRYMRNQKHSDGKEYRVYANYSACVKCPCKADCTKSKYRQLLRLLYQNELDAIDERTRQNKQLYRKRSEIVEHPFGTIKAVWGYKQYLCRTKVKVNAETALAYLAYNFRRLINIFAGGIEDLVKEIGMVMHSFCVFTQINARLTIKI